MNAEMNTRIEQSFTKADIVIEVLGGPGNAMLAESIRQIGTVLHRLGVEGQFLENPVYTREMADALSALFHMLAKKAPSFMSTGEQTGRGATAGMVAAATIIDRARFYAQVIPVDEELTPEMARELGNRFAAWVDSSDDSTFAELLRDFKGEAG